jgi:hypothetical protein
MRGTSLASSLLVVFLVLIAFARTVVHVRIQRYLLSQIVGRDQKTGFISGDENLPQNYRYFGGERLKCVQVASSTIDARPRQPQARNQLDGYDPTSKLLNTGTTDALYPRAADALHAGATDTQHT